MVLYPATRNLERAVEQYEGVMGALTRDPAFFAFRVKSDQARELEALIRLHGNSAGYAQQVDEIKKELAVLAKRVKGSEVDGLLRRRHELEKTMHSELTRQFRHAQITARTQEASLEDLVKRTKSAYEAKLELSVKRPLNDTLRDQMLAAFDQNKAAEKLLTRTKSRSQGLRSEQAWVETLRSRIQAAQHPPPMPSGPAQRAVRHGEQRMSPVQEDEQGEASRALGKAMGRRAARRYWGVGY